MATLKQTISERSLNSALKELGTLERKLQKLPKTFLGELAQECAEMAQDNFSDVFYAGPQEHIDSIEVRARQASSGNWEVIARGEAVQWIEFGTGVEGENTYDGELPDSYEYGAGEAGPPSHPDGYDFWYFYGSGDLSGSTNVRTQKETFYRVKGEPDTAVDADTFQSYLQSGFVKKKEAEKFWESFDKETGVYSTTGNPANNCLYNAFQEILDSVQDRAEEYMQK